MQHPLQQNGSTEHSRGVVIPKEELDKTSKEEIIETSDEDKTRADISGSQQVESGGNHDQATNQKELNPQDDDAIRPQASKDNPLHGLPTPAQSPEPQPNITTASTNREPRFEHVPEKEARPRQEIRGDIDNKLVTFCQGVPAREIAVSNPREDLSQLISKLQSLIVVWEKEYPS